MTPPEEGDFVVTDQKTDTYALFCLDCRETFRRVSGHTLSLKLPGRQVHRRRTFRCGAPTRLPFHPAVSSTFGSSRSSYFQFTLTRRVGQNLNEPILAASGCKFWHNNTLISRLYPSKLQCAVPLLLLICAQTASGKVQTLKISHSCNAIQLHAHGMFSPPG